MRQIKNLRSLMFAKNNIEKNVKINRRSFQNYKERFERSLHLWKNTVDRND